MKKHRSKSPHIPALLAAALWLTSAGIASAAWTSFHGDGRNSGYSINDAPFDSLLAWTYDAVDSIFYSSPVVDENGVIYTGTLGDELIAIGSDGELDWSYEAGGNFRHSTPAIGSDGTIYIGSADGVLHAVNADGSPQWTRPLLSALKTSPNIARDGTIYIGAENGRLYAVDAGGIVQWSYPTGGAIRSAPAIAPDGTILFGALDGKLYALHPNGSLRWAAQTNDQIKFCAPAVSEAGVVYFGSYDGFLYAVTLDQQLLWAYPTGHVMRSSPAIGPLGRIFVGSDTRLLAILPDGTLDWDFDTGGVIYSSPVYFGDDDAVGIGSDDGLFYLLGADGSLDWTFTVGSPIRTIPGPGSEGRIIVAALDGMIWAMGSDGANAIPEIDGLAGLGIRPERNPALGSVVFRALDAGAAIVDLTLFDVNGRRIVTLPGGGSDLRVWDGFDAAGRRVPAGTYFYRLADRQGAGRITLLR